MTEWQAARRLARTAQKWRDLVNRRCAHFIELHKTGRWKRYYGEAQFLLLMSEAVTLAEAWARIAPRPDDDHEAVSAEADPVENPPRRRSAA
jgi:uncharacterized repeat protein (TIGR03809 family)